MHTLNSLVVIMLSAAVAGAQDLLTDVTQIQRYWGQISPYADNPEDYFGVDYVGIPDGCQIVSQQSPSCAGSS